MRGGYTQGETKRFVIEAHRLGLTVEEAVRRSGKSYGSIYSASSRNGIKLPSENPKAKWGSVKSAVAKAEEDGLSAIALHKLTGIKLSSIRDCQRDYGFRLKHHKQYIKEKASLKEVV